MMLIATQGCDEIQSKNEYGTLQVVEYDHRQTPIAIVEIVEKDGYWLAGFPAAGGERPNVWVLLNPGWRPHYKQMPPDAPFKVSRQAFETVKNTNHTSKEIRSALEARILEKGN